MKNTILNKLQLLENNGRLPHALLLVSTNEELVNNLGEKFAKWLLCLQKEENCSCKSCTLFEAGTHSDFIGIEPKASGSTLTIKIDEIRVLVNYLQQQPQFSTNKVGLLTGVQYLNESAANSFLKTLEEPAGNTVLILTCSNADLLLSTLTSRCAIFTIDDETVDNAQLELNEQLESGLYELLVEKNTNIVALAGKWSKYKSIDTLDNLWIILNKLVKQQCSELAEENYASNYSHSNKLVEIGQKQKLSQLWPILDKVSRGKALLCNGKQLNIHLFLENLLIAWKE